MILGWVAMILANAAVCVAVRSLLRRVGSGRLPVDVVLFLLLRAMLISGVVLVAGMTGLLSTGPLILLSLLTLAAFLSFGPNRRLPRLPPLPWSRLAVLLASLAGLRLLFQAWYFSPYNVDPLSYHLPKLAEWVRAGGFTKELGGDVRSWFPAGFELIETWWVVFLHHDVLVEMAGIEFLGLAFAATYALGRELGIDSRMAFWAALLVAMIPGYQLQATACTNDLPVAALWIALAALLTARSPAGLLLLAAGLGVGVKGTFIYALPGLALWGWLLRRKQSVAEWTGGRWAVGVGTAALGIGLFWFARNAVFWHNPVYPMGTSAMEVGGQPLQSLRPELERLLLNLSFLIDPALLDLGYPHGPLLVHSAGWGVALVACGIPSLLIVLLTDPLCRRLAACFALSVASVLCMVTFDGISLRFVLFFPALLALVAARVVPTVPGAWWVVGAALAFQFVGTLLPGEIGATRFRELTEQGWRVRGSTPGLPEGVPGCCIGLDARVYQFYGPDFSRRVVYVRGKTPDDILRELDLGGANWVYEYGASRGVKAALNECVQRGRLRLLRPGIYAMIEKR